MGWMVNTTLPAALPQRKRPGTHCTGGWVGPRAGLDGCGKSRPPPGIRSPDRPARSESLYRLSYPGPQWWFNMQNILYQVHLLQLRVVNSAGYSQNMPSVVKCDVILTFREIVTTFQGSTAALSVRILANEVYAETSCWNLILFTSCFMLVLIIYI